MPIYAGSNLDPVKGDYIYLQKCGVFMLITQATLEARHDGLRVQSSRFRRHCSHLRSIIKDSVVTVELYNAEEKNSCVSVTEAFRAGGFEMGQYGP